MRIGIDATPAYCQGAGIGRYSRGLLRGLAEVDQHNQYRLLRPRRAPFELPSWPSNFEVRVPWLSEKMLGVIWHRLHLLLTAEVFVGDVDIFYSSDFVLPPLRKARSVVTVHDLSYLVLPDCAEAGLKAYLKAAVPPTLRRASLILADSINTKQDLVRLMDVQEDRVEVLYSAVEASYRPVTDEEQRLEAAQRLRLDRPFLLTVGTLEPRKNLVRLLEAFDAIRRDFPHELIVVGRPGWMYRDIYRTVDRLGLQDRVRFLGFLADADLPVVYCLADAFVYPSLYEGFGLPPLEAMACATPVVCSNTSSLPEVVGDAALQVEPADVAGLEDAMRRVLSDPDLRRKMVAAGLNQAAKFDWKSSARRLISLFERVRA